MAIYHLHASTGSRAGGQSAAAKLNYICREQKYEKGRDDLVYRQYGNMPKWIENKPVEYWKAADIHERANGRLFKEVEVALPKALYNEEQIELSKKLAHHLTREEKLPYVLAIHDKDGSNPHCHIMISTRANDGAERDRQQWFKRANPDNPELGGAKKTRSLMPKEWLMETREKWAQLGNEALEKVGQTPELDHRSYKEQGIDKTPGIHLGPKVFAMELQGKRCDRATDYLERDKVVEKEI